MVEIIYYLFTELPQKTHYISKTQNKVTANYKQMIFKNKVDFHEKNSRRLYKNYTFLTIGNNHTSKKSILINFFIKNSATRIKYIMENGINQF